MHDHSEIYQLFSAYFWLIFPIGVGVILTLGAYLHHRRFQRALEVIQACATQGREAPPEVMALIQPRRREPDPVTKAQSFTLVSFILLAAAAGFVVLALALGSGARPGLSFVVVVALGLAIAFLAAARMVRRDADRLNRP
jgi:hypothetical protein